jgi:hypothetical protein
MAGLETALGRDETIDFGDVLNLPQHREQVRTRQCSYRGTLFLC